MLSRQVAQAAAPNSVALPTIKPWLVDGFYRFCRYYMRRQFHAVAVDQRELKASPLPDDCPMICYANHPGWWDPILAVHLCKSCFPGRKLYAPIDAQALKKYRVFAQMGFYGIELHSLHGAADFLRISKRILAEPKSSLWITPEGRFADPRDHTAPLMPGLAHLALQHENLYLVPLAMEYVFWEERLPEALQRIGRPIHNSEIKHLSKPQALEFLAARLRDNQKHLADSIIARRGEDFEVQISGKSGAWGFYDALRKMKARFSGEKLDLHHGSKLNS
jgi:1-acyl-sn-glycerol-3-phosphate acyltransferase